MLRLEQIAKGSTLNGIVPSAAVTEKDFEHEEVLVDQATYRN